MIRLLGGFCIHKVIYIEIHWTTIKHRYFAIYEILTNISYCFNGLWKNFVLCKITVISAINVGKTESKTNTLYSSPLIYHLPFCPLLLVFLSLCGRISPDFFTYFLCVSCFFPLLVFLTLPCLCTLGLCVFV